MASVNSTDIVTRIQADLEGIQALRDFNKNPLEASMNEALNDPASEDDVTLVEQAGAGFDQMQAMTQLGLSSAFNTIFGENSVSDILQRWGEKNLKESAEVRTEMLEDAGISNAGKWWVNTFLTQGPSTGLSIAATSIGGLLGFMVGGPPGAAAGAAGLGYLTNTLLNAGENNASQLMELGVIDHEVALTAGATNAILDTIIPYKVGRIVSGKLAKKRGKFTEGFNKHVKKEIEDGTASAGRLSKGLRWMVVEGGTEGAQEAINEMFINYLKKEPIADFTSDEWAHIREAAYAGGLVFGGPLGFLTGGKAVAPAEGEAGAGEFTPPKTIAGFPVEPETDEDGRPIPRFYTDPVDGTNKRLPDTPETQADRLKILNQLKYMEDSPVPSVPGTEDAGKAPPPIPPVEYVAEETPGIDEPTIGKVPPINEAIPTGNPPVDVSIGTETRFPRTKEAIQGFNQRRRARREAVEARKNAQEDADRAEAATDRAAQRERDTWFNNVEMRQRLDTAVKEDAQTKRELEAEFDATELKSKVTAAETQAHEVYDMLERDGGFTIKDMRAYAAAEVTKFATKEEQAAAKAIFKWRIDNLEANRKQAAIMRGEEDEGIVAPETAPTGTAEETTGGRAEAAAPTETQKQITALEELIAEREAAISIMVEGDQASLIEGMQKDGELYKTLKETLANKKRLAELQAKADQEAATREEGDKVPTQTETQKQIAATWKTLEELKAKAKQEAATGEVEETTGGQPKTTKKKTTKKKAAPKKKEEVIIPPVDVVTDPEEAVSAKDETKAAQEAIASVIDGDVHFSDAIDNLAEALGIENYDAARLFGSTLNEEQAGIITKKELDSDQTQEEQIQEMYDNDVAAAETAGLERDEAAELEKGREDKGPPEPPSTDAEIDASKKKRKKKGKKKTKKKTGPEKAVGKEAEEDVIKFVDEEGMSVATISNTESTVYTNDDGTYTAEYGSTIVPESFATKSQAQNYLVTEHGTPDEIANWKTTPIEGFTGRARKKKATKAAAKVDVTKAKKKERGKFDKGEFELNDHNVPIKFEDVRGSNARIIYAELDGEPVLMGRRKNAAGARGRAREIKLDAVRKVQRNLIKAREKEQARSAKEAGVREAAIAAADIETKTTREVTPRTILKGMIANLLPNWRSPQGERAIASIGKENQPTAQKADTAKAILGEDTEGHEVVVNYPRAGRQGVIKPFSMFLLKTMAAANAVRESIVAQPSLFHDFLVDRITDGNAMLAPTGAADTAEVARQIKSKQDSINEINRKEVRLRRKGSDITPEEKSRRETYQREIDNLMREEDRPGTGVIVPGDTIEAYDSALDDWIATLNERASVAGRSPAIVKKINEALKLTEDEELTTEEYDFEGTMAAEKADVLGGVAEKQAADRAAAAAKRNEEALKLEADEAAKQSAFDKRKKDKDKKKEESEGVDLSAEDDQVLGEEATDLFLMEDMDAAINEEIARQEKEDAQDLLDKKNKTTADKLNPMAILLEDSATLASDLSRTPDRGGYSATQVRQLAASIKKAFPEFEYNPKSVKSEISQSIMSWHVAETTAEADAVGEAGKFETTENDEGLKTTRLKDVDWDTRGLIRTRADARRSLIRELNNIFGRKAVKRMERIGFINIIEHWTDTDWSTGRDDVAFVTPDRGQVFFITDAIKDKLPRTELRGLILHEIGVHVGRDLFTGREWAQILDEVYKLNLEGNEAVRAAVKKVMANYPDEQWRDSTGRPLYQFEDDQKLNIQFTKPFELAEGETKTGELFRTQGREWLIGGHLEEFKERKRFWEEVLAHVIDGDPYKVYPKNARKSKSFIKKIKEAFNKFFSKVVTNFGGTYQSETANVTIDDVRSLIGYAITHAPTLALARHGDPKAIRKLRNLTRKRFLENSQEKEVQYHSTRDSWSHPLISETELGLHVGTSIAAINKNRASHWTKDTPRGTTARELLESVGYSPVEIDAFEPGWEKKLTDRDLRDVILNWTTPITFKADDAVDIEQTIFKSGTVIKAGYIKVENPFYIDSEIGGLWNYAGGWKRWTSDMIRNEEGDSSSPRWTLIQAIHELSTLYETKRKNVRGYDTGAEIRTKLHKLEAEFDSKLIGLFKKNGHDSIAYINQVEDVGSTSYILFDPNQFMPVDSLTFKSGISPFMDKKMITRPYEEELTYAKKISDVASEETAKTVIGNAKQFSVVRFLQRLIEPLMTVEGYDQLETQRMLTKGKIGQWATTGRILFDIMDSATTAEKKIITKFFTTRGANPSMLPDKQVDVATRRTILKGDRPGAQRNTRTVSLRDEVVKAKKMISDLGKELVSMGMITKEQYAEWENKYLPRIYLKNVLSGADRMGLGFKSSPLNYTKQRKHERFLQDIIEGRIDDPALLASRYIQMAGSDIAVMKYLEFIVSDPGNNGWVLPGQVIKVRGMSGTAPYFAELADAMSTRADLIEKYDPAKANQARKLAKEMRIKADAAMPDFKGVDMSKYRQVPKSERYGQMQGLWVMKDIWNDIQGNSGLGGNSVLMEMFRYAQTGFKYTHVPLNVPTQFRNVGSNFILMDTSGTNFLRIPGLLSKAVVDIFHNGKYHQIAQKYGLETTTFASEELLRIDKELAKVQAKDNSIRGMMAKGKIFFDNYIDIGGRTYQASEVLFKTAKIMDLMENHGKTEAEAARLANEALIDYSNVSVGIRALRSLPLGSPFITFNAKVTAQLVRNFKNHPLSFAKYVALPWIVREWVLSENDDLDEEDLDDLKKFLHKHMAENKGTLVMPTKDQNGKWQVIPFNYFAPWGFWLNFYNNTRGLFVEDEEARVGEALMKDTGILSGPAEIGFGLAQNVDPFTGHEIWNEFDTPAQQYQDITAYLASYFVPPMLMPRNRSGDIVKGGGPLIKTMMAYNYIEGNVGQDGLPKYTIPQALLSWMGVNITTVGRHDAMAKAYYSWKDVEKIQRRLLKIITDPSLRGQPSRRLELIQQYQELMLNKSLEAREISDALNKMDKLFNEAKASRD